MLTAITSTIKTDRVLKSGSIIPAGTSYVVGIKLDTLGSEGARIREETCDRLAGRIVRSKDKTEKIALRVQLKAEESRGIVTVKGQEFLLLLSKVHPSIVLTNDQKSALGRILKGATFAPELVAEA